MQILTTLLLEQHLELTPRVVQRQKLAKILKIIAFPNPAMYKVALKKNLVYEHVQYQFAVCQDFDMVIHFDCNRFK